MYVFYIDIAMHKGYVVALLNVLHKTFHSPCYYENNLTFI